MNSETLREKFKTFFESKEHTWIPSASLVPKDDPSVLFTTAGMHPLVPYILGEKHPGGSRIANAQKCIRTTDIDEVGDNTHLTFFEMLGNWSFGDYFKEEAINWSFEFLTDKKWLGINPELLYVSIFAGDKDVPKDEEAIKIWQESFSKHSDKSLQAEFSEDIYDLSGNNRIFAYGRDKNWWQAGETGPAGPDTEIFVDTEGDLPKEMQVKHKKSGIKNKCHINCDCGRFVEIWNNVFMQYNGLGNGEYEELPQKNVDTGMGLERVAAYLSGNKNIFEIQSFLGAFEIILEKNKVLTNQEEIKTRIILDHIKAAVFIIADGVVPSNKQRGYVLRRLLRRSLAYARLLAIDYSLLEKVVVHYISYYKNAYPELAQKQKDILQAINDEKEKFKKTLDLGIAEAQKKLSTGKQLDGDMAFNLYQSYGLPLEIIKEFFDIVHPEKFEERFKEHQDISQTAAAGSFKGGLAGTSEKIIKLHTVTHLLNQALRQVLGDHVYQKGSNITEERTRFDFTHDEKMTDDQKEKVEELVNNWIEAGLEVKQEMMSEKEARELGAIGVFGEKYPEVCSVYTILDKDNQAISREFCGGPHVKNTGDIGHFKIIKEQSSSAGVRRIKAIIE